MVFLLFLTEYNFFINKVINIIREEKNAKYIVNQT